VRLRGTAFVLFASGFAGTALEIVLLLAFQVLCGSVYHQLGIIVTVFMAGLALGAALANRPTKSGSNGEEMPKLVGLRCRAAQILLPACATPAAKKWLRRPAAVPSSRDRLTTPTAALTARHLALLAFAIAAYAILLAFLLPLFNRLEFDGTVAGASRLYTADFIGAFLGALLASALLIPLIGVTAVCLLTAALNLAAAAMALLI